VVLGVVLRAGLWFFGLSSDLELGLFWAMRVCEVVGSWRMGQAWLGVEVWLCVANGVWFSTVSETQREVCKVVVGQIGGLMPLSLFPPIRRFRRAPFYHRQDAIPLTTLS
jgi:hypothetical protein